MYHVIRPWLKYGVPTEEHFMPESFRAAGYQTGMAGKRHLGHFARKSANAPQRLRRFVDDASGARWIEEELRPFTPGGVMQGVVCVARPLADAEQQCESDRLELLESHRTREAIHAAVVDSALDCIVVIDAQGRVVEFNPAASATFGYSREHAIGRTVAELIVPVEMREHHNSGLERFRAGGPASVIGQRVELEATCADGSRIPVELAIRVVVGSGPSALFTAHLRDLRPAREAQTQIERQREALYQNEKLAALGSLLAGWRMNWTIPGLGISSDVPVYRGAGCPECGGTGYRGRTGIYEILTLTRPLRDLIANNATENEIRQAAVSRGMGTLGRSALEKVTSGVTTTDEVYRVVETDTDFASACPQCATPMESDFVMCPSCGYSASAACPGCSRMISPEWKFCPYCRQDLLKPEARRNFA